MWYPTHVHYSPREVHSVKCLVINHLKLLDHPIYLFPAKGKKFTEKRACEYTMSKEKEIHI